MTAAEWLGLGLAGIVMLAGLIGTVIPGIPGAPLILAAAVGHKIWFGEASVSYVALVLLLGLTLLSLALDLLGTLVGAKKLGATWRGMAGAVAGVLVGLFFGLPGLIIGPIVGAVLFELLGGRALGESAKAGAGALIGMVLGGLGRILCCVLMMVVFGVSLYFSHTRMKPALAGAANVLGGLETGKKFFFTNGMICRRIPAMSPQALHLTPADIPSETQFLLFSPEHGIISEHCSEEGARASFSTYLSEVELGEYIPFLLKRSGEEEWEIAEC